MVVGTLQQVPSKGRISIMKIQNFTVQKRSSVIKLSYGVLLVMIGIVMAAINPIQIITHWFVDMREGSFIFNMWSNPTYELFVDTWVFNYTNTQEYLSGAEKVMRLKEVGPFRYKELRTNSDMRVDKERGVMSMNPHMSLKFLKEESIDDPENINFMFPNVPLMAVSTLAADKLGYFANVGAYYSITALGPKLFKELTAQEILWGYHDSLVTLANSLLPGWIDFKKIGLLDRIYPDKQESAEVELTDPTKRYSLISWNNSTGLKEQGFTNWNTSVPCNRITGTYEGLMLSPNFEKGRNWTLFRKQACRAFPFSYVEEKPSEFGFPAYRFTMDQNAFSKSSPYDCPCTENCVPEGIIDINNCYYKFPIALTKPHFLDVDPVHQAYYEGMEPNIENHTSFYEVEPNIGIPLKFAIKFQINLAVRMSSGNPITKPVKDKVLPLIWVQLSCEQPPSNVITLLKLRLVIGPPLYITIVVLLFTVGFILGAQGFYRVLKPRYKVIPPTESAAPIVRDRRRSQERRKSSVHENIGFKVDDELDKEAVSLLAINEDESEFVELLIVDDENDSE